MDKLALATFRGHLILMQLYCLDRLSLQNIIVKGGCPLDVVIVSLFIFGIAININLQDFKVWDTKSSQLLCSCVCMPDSRADDLLKSTHLSISLTRNAPA